MMKPVYRFEPAGMDLFDPHDYTPAKGTLVTKEKLSGVRQHCQAPFTSVQALDGPRNAVVMVLRASLIRIKASEVPSWKAGAYAKGEGHPSFNALRFATRKEAQAYASDLYSRWMGCDKVEVFPSSDPVCTFWYVPGKDPCRMCGEPHRSHMHFFGTEEAAKACGRAYANA